ncbi:MAG: rod shape-determining protein RodA, partial [Acidobacteriales bacterium]
MAEYRSSRDFDWPLLLLAVAICALGILQIYSATMDTVWRATWWKQALFLGLGLLLMYVTSKVDYHRLLEHVPLFYGVSLALLAVVLLLGRQVFGSRRWIPLPGGFTFQVSEFVKLVIVLLAARYLSELRSDRPDFRDLLKLGGLVALPMILVLKQPALGTALTYVVITAGIIFVAGLRWQHALAIG